jgi:hypothetical protein
LANTIRCTLALAMLMAVACGDDSGGDDDTGGNDKDSGSESPKDAGKDASTDAGGGLSLADALKTDGTNVTDARANVLFSAACEKQIKCDQESMTSCVSTGLQMWNAGKAAGYDDACLDATLDLYACFASNDCHDFDTVCNDAGQRQEDSCSKYTPDSGT